MNIPKNLLYSASHEWVKFNADGSAYIGLTDYAQDALGDIVFVNLCDVGEQLEPETVMGDVESIKAVSDIYAPIDGTVEEINEEVLENAGLINSVPYDAWLVKVSGVSDKSNLVSADEYEEILRELA